MIGTFYMFIYDYIVSQMNTMQYEQSKQPHSEHISPDSMNLHERPGSKHKKNYIGLTLMQYFKIGPPKADLEEIDEESNSSISAGTPFFADVKETSVILPKSKKHRRDKVKTQVDDDLLPLMEKTKETHLSKISTINLEQISIIDRSIIKLPSIHEQRRGLNNSRQGMIKQGKMFHSKKQGSIKSKHDQVVSLGKYHEIARIHEGQKNVLPARKAIRARVTSTSFYHGKQKERQRQFGRIKTQEEIPERTFDKSFIVTRYGMGFIPKKSKQDLILPPKKDPYHKTKGHN